MPGFGDYEISKILTVRGQPEAVVEAMYMPCTPNADPAFKANPCITLFHTSIVIAQALIVFSSTPQPVYSLLHVRSSQVWG